MYMTYEVYCSFVRRQLKASFSRHDWSDVTTVTKQLTEALALYVVVLGTTVPTDDTHRRARTSSIKVRLYNGCSKKPSKLRLSTLTLYVQIRENKCVQNYSSPIAS